VFFLLFRVGLGILLAALVFRLLVRALLLVPLLLDRLVLGLLLLVLGRFVLLLFLGGLLALLFDLLRVRVLLVDGDTVALALAAVAVLHWLVAVDGLLQPVFQHHTRLQRERVAVAVLDLVQLDVILVVQPLRITAIRQAEILAGAVLLRPQRLAALQAQAQL